MVSSPLGSVLDLDMEEWDEATSRKRATWQGPKPRMKMGYDRLLGITAALIGVHVVSAVKKTVEEA